MRFADFKAPTRPLLFRLPSSAACMAVLTLLSSPLLAIETPPAQVEAGVRALETQALALLKSGDEAREAWCGWYVAAHRLIPQANSRA